MCGITGRMGISPVQEELLRSRLLAMNEVHGRRGPDGRGVYVSPDGRAGLGHTRLAILDLSDLGAQPMAGKDRRVWITFNGEIYNFPELRRRLERAGAFFRTRTDTEVILELYARHGTAAFPMLRGMFAFAIWDERTGEGYLVRDRYGIKPVYWHAGHGEVHFASTVRALVRSGRTPGGPDPDAPIAFLLTGSIPSPMTTAKDVRSLPPGHYARFADGGLSLHRYYGLDFSEKRAVSKVDAIAEVRARFRDAVESHLISDAPLGVFLSGGIDSSLITALAAVSRNDPVVTVSVNLDDRRFDEEPYQRLVAEAYGTEHRKVVLKVRDVFDMLHDFWECMDQPSIDGLNTFVVSRAARDAGLKTVLSGLGGDELFCGYESTRRYPWMRAVMRAPVLPRVLAYLLGRTSRKYARLGTRCSSGRLGSYLVFRGLFGSRELSRLFGQARVDEVLARLVEAAGDATGKDPVDELSEMEFRHYLLNQLLRDSDTMGMAHSVEIRVPFLDHPLVDYVASLSAKIRCPKGVPKGLLADACRDLLPERIWARRKQGFTFPFESWMRGQLGEEMRQVAFPHARIRAFFDESMRGFRAGRDHWSRPYALHVFGRFFSSI